jgi:hypothetical protein
MLVLYPKLMFVKNEQFKIISSLFICLIVLIIPYLCVNLLFDINSTILVLIENNRNTVVFQSCLQIIL